MNSSPLFVVSPDSLRWRCRREGGEAVSEHGTKAEAIDRARQLARAAGGGRVRVHHDDGRLEQQWTYEPRRHRSAPGSAEV